MGVDRVKAAVVKSMDASLVADELNRLGRRKADLEAEMAAGANDIPPALQHPRLAQICRDKIERLLDTFEAEGSRAQAQAFPPQPH